MVFLVDDFERASKTEHFEVDLVVGGQAGKVLGHMLLGADSRYVWAWLGLHSDWIVDVF